MERYGPTETNTLEIPTELSDLQRLTWTIAAALMQYGVDPSTVSGDDALIIELVNDYGVHTPM